MTDKPSNAPEKLWGGRFTEQTDAFVEAFTASVSFDRRMAAEDIAGSIAHAEMLTKVGILTADDLKAIEAGLSQIQDEIKKGEFEWRVDREDLHMNIEARLTEIAGDVGKRLHTGRSRNDQVATDLRLYLRGEIDGIVAAIDGFLAGLVDLAERTHDAIMPGFTHLQVAQPVTFGHHILAWAEMMERDRARMLDCRKRTNQSPLGAAALAGTTFPIDRNLTAELLGFEGVCQNSLDAVSDRDFVIEFCSAASLNTIPKRFVNFCAGFPARRVLFFPGSVVAGRSSRRWAQGSKTTVEHPKCPQSRLRRRSQKVSRILQTSF